MTTIPSEDTGLLRTLLPFGGEAVWTRWACEAFAATAQARAVMGLPLPTGVRYPMVDNRSAAEKIAAHWIER